MNKSDSIKNLAVAMCKAQGEMGGAIKGKENPFFKKNYADLGAVVEAVKEPFANNGLSYVQFPINDIERIGVETILMHESGEFLSHSFTVKATKQDAQGAGSVITYCRRYGLQAVAGIPSEDDDGNAASKPQGNNTQSKPAPSINPDIIAAIDCKDHIWVQENWPGVIAAGWNKFNNQQIEQLNKLINTQG